MELVREGDAPIEQRLEHGGRCQCTKSMTQKSDQSRISDVQEWQERRAEGASEWRCPQPQKGGGGVDEAHEAALTAKRADRNAPCG